MSHHGVSLRLLVSVGFLVVAVVRLWLYVRRRR